MRAQGWERRLIDYIQSVAKTKFEWGKHDCFIFTGQCVKAIRGDNYIDDMIGKYHDAQSSLDYAKSIGVRNHIHFVARKFKPRPSPFSMMRGDIAVLPGLQGDFSLGICQGTRAYTVGKNGLYTVCASQVRKAFEI